MNKAKVIKERNITWCEEEGLVWWVWEGLSEMGFSKTVVRSDTRWAALLLSDFDGFLCSNTGGPSSGSCCNFRPIFCYSSSVGIKMIESIFPSFGIELDMQTWVTSVNPSPKDVLICTLWDDEQYYNYGWVGEMRWDEEKEDLLLDSVMFRSPFTYSSGTKLKNKRTTFHTLF